MAHHITKEITLKYSTPFNKGKLTKVEKEMEAIELSDTLDNYEKRDLIKKIKAKHYRKLNKGRLMEKDVLEKTIHSYRMWFLFLKLALELEANGADLVMKRLSGKPSITRRIRVDRRKYKKWDLDEVLEDNFNTWWKSHRYLFNDEITKVLSPNAIVSDEKKHLTTQIDISMRTDDIIKNILFDIKKAKKESGKLTKNKPKYHINSSIHKDTIVSRFNCLVLKINNYGSNEDIITSSYVRGGDKLITQTMDGNKDYGRLMYGFLLGSGQVYGAKHILLSVCDGYFLKNPNKTKADYEK